MVHGVGFLGLTILEARPTGVPVAVRSSQLEWLSLDPLPAPEPVEPVQVPDDPPDPIEPTPTPEPVAPPVPEPPRLEPQPPTPEATPAEQPPPQIPERALQAVEQQSHDPSVEAPPDAQYMAAENQRVEEETVAEERSIRSDEALATPPPPDGDPSDGEQPTDDPADDPHEGSPAEAAAVAASAAAAASASRPVGAVPPTPAVSAPRPRTAATPTPVEMEAITVDDGFGTFSVERPRTTTARVDPREGGPRPDRTAPRPNLQVGFAGFEQVYGAEQLASERAERRAEREALAASSGNHRRERMEQYRFAAENFLPTVRPGNQTALNAAASPYASWISDVHRRIHAQFAERFIPRIGNHDPALSNPELYAEMEFVVDARGRVLRVAIVRTSGVSSFDLGAFNSILDAQPLPVPPEAIYSGDGRVYLIWGFSRGPSQCHTMQARPFILPNPPPLVAMPGVVPDEPHRPARFATDDESAPPQPSSTLSSRPSTVGRGPRRSP